MKQNHLDFPTVLWLEDYLTKYTKTLIVVSHDRKFLDNVCTDVMYVIFEMQCMKNNITKPNHLLNRYARGEHSNIVGDVSLCFRNVAVPCLHFRLFFLQGVLNKYNCSL